MNNTEHWKEITGSTTGEKAMWDINSHNVIQGILKEVRHDIGQNNSSVYTLDTENGMFDFWGSTVLDTRLKNVSIGQKVRIRYEGIKTNPNSGREYKDFKVWISTM